MWLGGRGVWRTMGTCICMAESLHCSSETITTLLSAISHYKMFLVLKKIKLKKCMWRELVGLPSKLTSLPSNRQRRTCLLRTWMLTPGRGITLQLQRVRIKETRLGLDLICKNNQLRGRSAFMTYETNSLSERLL